MGLDFTPAIDQLRNMADGFVRAVPGIMLGLIVFFFFYLGSRLASHSVQRVTNRYRRQKNLGLVLGRLTQWLILLGGMLVTAVVIFPNFTPARLIELLGIGSVAIGFAFRDILQNFLAGILLLLTEPFRIGDQIIVGGYEGTVEDIQTRATMIRTYDGRRVVIPNADLFVDSVTVNTANTNRRLEYVLGIGYGDDVEAARRLVFAALDGCSTVLSDPKPQVLLHELAPSSVNLRIRWWIEPPSRHNALDSLDEVLTAIKQQMHAHGVDLPYTTYQVLFHDQTEETDGDRLRQREGWPARNGEAPSPRRLPVTHALNNR
jgi:small-conductance mechanosensitive channel